MPAKDNVVVTRALCNVVFLRWKRLDVGMNHNAWKDNTVVINGNLDGISYGDHIM